MDLVGYTTIAELAEAEHTEKRSRFLSCALPVSDEAAAARYLDEIRSRHRDASHNCYAYILRTGGAQRYSDDGEPQGTAGMPILEVLRRRELTDVMVVVTRYFGGILLGAGGLVRAYTQGAALALDAAKTLRMRQCIVFSLHLAYPLYGKVQNLLSSFEALVLEEDFGERITMTLRIQNDKLPALAAQLGELSAGAVSPVIISEEFAAL